MNTIFLDKVLDAVADSHGVSEDARIPFKYGYLQGIFCNESGSHAEIVRLAQKYGIEVEA